MDGPEHPLHPVRDGQQSAKAALDYVTHHPWAAFDVCFCKSFLDQTVFLSLISIVYTVCFVR